MRLIDADDIPYTMLYKENWMEGTGEEAQGAWKSDIDRMPTVDLLGQTVYGYSIRFLVYVATVMEKKGITAEQAAEIVMDMRAFVQLFYEEQKEITRKAFEEIGKSQKSYVDWELRRE